MSRMLNGGTSTSSAPKRGRWGDLEDRELVGLTVFEKKCVLINREIDSNGRRVFVVSYCSGG